MLADGGPRDEGNNSYGASLAIEPTTANASANGGAPDQRLADRCAPAVGSGLNEFRHRSPAAPPGRTAQGWMVLIKSARKRSRAFFWKWRLDGLSAP